MEGRRRRRRGKKQQSEFLGVGQSRWGGGTGISQGRLPGSAGSSADRNVGEMSPEARMRDKARVNKERLKGLATMGRHPSRDEIASEDYWGEAVSVVRLFTPVRVWLGICVCERAHACVYVRVCVQRGGVRWIDGCPSGWGAREANRLFPQSVLPQPPLTHGGCQAASRQTW